MSDLNESYDSHLCTFIVVGLTGAGKSEFLCNIATTRGHGTLPPGSNFMVSDGIDSCTRRIEFATSTVTTLSGSVKVRFADTPGLSDSAGQDQTILRDIVGAIRQVDDCAAVIVVIDGSNPRFTDEVKTLFEYLRDILGTDTVHNLVLAFSRCHEADVEERRRNPAKFARAWSKKVCEIWCIDFIDIPSFYINSRRDDPRIPYAPIHDEEMDKLMIRCRFNTLITLTAAREVDTREVAADKLIEAEKVKAEAAEAHAAQAEADAARMRTEGEESMRLHNQQMQEMKATIAKLEKKRNRFSWMDAVATLCTAVAAAVTGGGAAAVTKF